MIQFLIGIAIYTAIAVVLKDAGLTPFDWQYWAIPLLAIAAEINEGFRQRTKARKA
jgi:hypothetical protein